MGIFGKSEMEKRIESVQNEVRKMTSLAMKLDGIIANGKSYCLMNESEIIDIMNQLNSHNSSLNIHSKHLSPERMTAIKVPWGVTGEYAPYTMWAMAIESSIQSMGQQLYEWGL